MTIKAAAVRDEQAVSRVLTGSRHVLMKQLDMARLQLPVSGSIYSIVSIRQYPKTDIS